MIFKGESTLDSDILLNVPLGSDTVSAVLPQRLEIPYKNVSQKYELYNRKDTTNQYCKMYSQRLSMMRPRIEETIKSRRADLPIKRLHELKDAKECAIIGTLFKRQVLKPSILKDISEEHKLIPQPIFEKFTSETDDIILEDEMQRIQLVGNIDLAQLVTGIVCGVIGEEKVAGKFDVTEICFAQLTEPQSTYAVDSERFMLVVSGLDLNGSSEANLSLELLVDYVMGQIGQPSEQAAVCNIARVVIAGNSICGSKNQLGLRDKTRLVQDFDDIVAQLASLCPVDVMPGEFDPSSHMLPQQPLHRCLLPKASRFTSFQNVSNPYEFEIGGRTVVGFSGQNVHGVEQCCALTDPIDVLERLCQWAHVAPTAPDTLAAYPFFDTEPFIMDSLPDIMFTGNQKCFSYKHYRGAKKDCLLLSVPKFSDVGVCALINLKTMQVEPIQFGVEQQL